MSRRRSRAVAPSVAPAHDALGGLAASSARADLCWLARHQRDVAAREAGTGRALTGMPVHQSTEPRLPGQLDGPDLSGEIARHLDQLVRELLDVGWQADAQTEAGRWLQAAQVVDKVIDTDMDAMAWWDTASGLRARAERVLGPDARGRWLGPCAVPECDGDVRLGDDQTAAVCPQCGVFVTREQQEDYLADAMAERLMSVSELATALTQVVGRVVEYDTVRTWTRTRNAPRGRRLPARLHERHDDGSPWRGIPWPTPDTGLYRFADALTLVARRETRVQLGVAA
ncbi:hypothetical protein ACFS27_03325 [Promicromonospora vindobonensis]|uniref:TFIIB-like protein n=1 Tax=Promicromonospora vindobonensis TaxID=195748 RepID=A0ABW5VLT2_9MICO